MTYEQVVAKVKAKFADADPSNIDGVPFSVKVL